MIEKNILRSLSNDDWNTAQQVFSQQKEVFPEGVQQDYSEKIRSTFARFEARRIWQRAQEEAASGQQDAKTVALLLINEPDEDLHQSVQQEITRLADLHNKKQAVFGDPGKFDGKPGIYRKPIRKFGLDGIRKQSIRDQGQI